MRDGLCLLPWSFNQYPDQCGALQLGDGTGMSHLRRIQFGCLEWYYKYNYNYNQNSLTAFVHSWLQCTPSLHCTRLCIQWWKVQISNQCWGTANPQRTYHPTWSSSIRQNLEETHRRWQSSKLDLEPELDIFAGSSLAGFRGSWTHCIPLYPRKQTRNQKRKNPDHIQCFDNLCRRM